MMILRHLLSILLLPVVVTIVVPRWLQRADVPLAGSVHASASAVMATQVIGTLFLVGGVALFLWCVALFANVGRGTLAPWDPTQRLVATGPYRFVRNPMISGVAGILAGEALLLRSPRVAVWLALFIVINEVYFRLVEEPGLERRFGDEYRRYRAVVPRWIPGARGGVR